jgi:hypothetical protein
VRALHIAGAQSHGPYLGAAPATWGWGLWVPANMAPATCGLAGTAWIALIHTQPRMWLRVCVWQRGVCEVGVCTCMYLRELVTGESMLSIVVATMLMSG